MNEIQSNNLKHCVIKDQDDNLVFFQVGKGWSCGLQSGLNLEDKEVTIQVNDMYTSRPLLEVAMCSPFQLKPEAGCMVGKYWKSIADAKLEAEQYLFDEVICETDQSSSY